MKLLLSQAWLCEGWFVTAGMLAGCVGRVACYLLGLLLLCVCIHIPTSTNLLVGLTADLMGMQVHTESVYVQAIQVELLIDCIIRMELALFTHSLCD